MSRRITLLSAFLLVLPPVARAQAPAPTPAAPTQLDRIESKLDQVLRRLDHPGPQPSGTGQPQTPVGPSNVPSSGTPAAVPATYKPGAVAVARPGPKDTNSLSQIPADDVGGFVYGGGPIALTDIHDRGVRYAGPVGVELQGWLQAREAGRYQIATDLNAHFGTGTLFGPTCLLQAWLEGRSLDQQTAHLSHPGSTDANATLVLGADLQPGLYRLRVWTACTAPTGVSTTSELLLKAPSEMNLRPVTGNDLLHKES